MNILVVFMLLLQLAVYPASALGAVKESTITVEQATQIVKDNFSIPEKYTQLSTGYNDYNNRATYSIDWHAVAMDMPGGSFHAEVDATTGEILSVNQWEHSLNTAFKLPVLSEPEAEKIATDLVSKLASTHQAKMQLLKDDQQMFTLNYMEPFTYNFRWVRIENDIQFPENGVNVSIGGDGQVRGYNNNWTEDLVFPEASKVISPEEASQVFTDTPMIELQYFLPQQQMRMMSPEISEPQRVLLVYQLTSKYYGGAIDALSGEPVAIDRPVGINKSNYSVSSVAVPSSAEATTPLIKAIDQDTSGENQQIGRDEAVEVVKKMIKIPKQLVLQGSSMTPDWQNPNEQVWDLNWGSESSNMGEANYLSARVNVKTGDLVSFNRSYATNPDNKSKHLTRDGAKKVAEDFLQGVQPEKFKLVKEDSEMFYGGGMPSDMEMFHYVRVVNGIPVSNNGMNIAVDTVAKQVINYDLTWTDVEFPSPADALPLNQATERFLKERPLALNYSLIFKQFQEKEKSEKPEVRLVYQPNMDSGMYMPSLIDAITGDLVDWYGKSESQWIKSHHYTDILGNFAEKEIGIMGLTGAFGEYGETFHPDEKITAGSLLRAMLVAEGRNRDRFLSDEDVLKTAKERGWIHDDLALGSELSRLDLSKIMIRLISMEPSAQVKGIYVVPFTDKASIAPESLGYISLTWGLGILKIDGDAATVAVLPNQIVTRAEAAYALVHAYALQPLNGNMKY